MAILKVEPGAINSTGNFAFGSVTTVANISVGGQLIVENSILPAVANIIDIGSETLRFGKLYLAGNTIDLGGTTISGSTDGVTFSSPAGNLVLNSNVSTFLTSVSSTGNIPGGSGGSGGAAVGFATMYQASNLEVYTGVTRWYAPVALNITNITPRLVVAADSNVNIDIVKNASVAATLTIVAGQNTATAFTSGIAMSIGDYLTISITQVGTVSYPGQDLYVQLQYART